MWPVRTNWQKKRIKPHQGLILIILASTQTLFLPTWRCSQDVPLKRDNLKKTSVTTSRKISRTIFVKNWKLTTITVVKIIYKPEYELEITKYPGKYSQWTTLLMQSCTTLVSSHQHKTMSHNLSSTHIIHTHTYIKCITTSWKADYWMNGKRTC